MRVEEKEQERRMKGEWGMSPRRSVEIVEEFWAAVWKGRDPEAIDRFVADDFVLTTGGVDIVSRAAFKEWVRQFLAKITDFEFEIVETFQNEDGSRVASRWRVSGKNNGVLGTRADLRPIAFTGTAVWAVREDGKLLHNWVERSWWELSQRLHSMVSSPPVLYTLETTMNTTTSTLTAPPVIAPPFTLETALRKVRLAEDAWNRCEPHRVSLAYTEDSVWRNRSEFITGRDAIRAFLTRKWEKEQEYRLVKALWAFTDDRIAVRFRYEWRDAAGNWFRSYGNELWEFDERGLMRRREASINDVPIAEAERTFFWPVPGPRPANHLGIPDVQ
jgi:hypothetical protein